MKITQKYYELTYCNDLGGEQCIFERTVGDRVEGDEPANRELQ